MSDAVATGAIPGDSPHPAISDPSGRAALLPPHVRAARHGGGRPSIAARRRRHEVLVAYLLLAPACALVPGILAYPLAWDLWSSLTNRSILHSSAAYVGLSNYLQILGASEFWEACGYTIGFIAATTLLKLAVGTAGALALSRPFRGRSLVFLAMFLPWAYPAGIAMIGWHRFIMPPVHTAYSALMTGLAVFVDTRMGLGAWGFLSLVAFNTWRGGAFTAIFILAALSAIPHELFDAAVLEARSGWRGFWLATLPLLRPFLALAAVLSLPTAAADLGNLWMQTGRQDVYPNIWTRSFHNAIIGGQWGTASALALVMLSVLILIFLGCYRFFQPLEDGGA